MIVCRVLGEYRLQHAGVFVGNDRPGSNSQLVIADEVLNQQGVPRDSLGYVFPNANSARLALNTITNHTRRFRL